MAIEVQGGDYEHVLALADGSAGGGEFTYRRAGLAALSKQVLGGHDFDAAEYSLANHIMLRARGEPRLDAIPVFPGRGFRNASVFVREDSPLTEPSQLAGQRVGVGEFAMTTAVWTRGLLHDRYGLDWRDIHWVTAAAPRFAPPAGLRVSESARDLEQLLREGGIDALLTGRPKSPEALPRLRPVLADTAAVEREYFAATGDYPIMHTVVLHTRLRTQPDVAHRLFNAYCAARRAALGRRLGAGFLPFTERDWDEGAARGGEAVRNGLTDRNRRSIERLSRYLREQGLIDVEPAIDSLFVPGSSTWIDEEVAA